MAIPTLATILHTAMDEMAKSRRQGQLGQMNLAEVVRQSRILPGKLDRQVSELLDADKEVAKIVLRSVPLLLLSGRIGAGRATLQALVGLLAPDKRTRYEIRDRDPDWPLLVLDAIGAFDARLVQKTAAAMDKLPEEMRRVLECRFPPTPEVEELSQPQKRGGKAPQEAGFGLATTSLTSQGSGVKAELVDRMAEEGKKLPLVGFGTFGVARRVARSGRNPQTGEVVKIKAAKVSRFKAGKALKDSVK